MTIEELLILLTETIENMPDNGAALTAIQELLANIYGIFNHLALETPFEEYTVIEALLFLIFLTLFISICWRILRSGFRWLIL